jgi:hypothetical protein
MLIEKKLKVIIFLQNIIWSVHASQSIEVIYAVNAGSNISHTDVDGIIYAKDDSKNDRIRWGYGLYHNVNPKDTIIYQEYAYAYTTTMEYNMPVKGDGKYWLILKNMEKFCSIGECVFDAIINGNHKILSNYNIFAKAGCYTVIDEFVYFEVCNDTLKFKNEISKINNSTITLAFQVKNERAKVSAIVLLKGDISLISKISRQNNTINPEYIELEQKYYCASVVVTKDEAKEIQQKTTFVIEQSTIAYDVTINPECEHKQKYSGECVVVTKDEAKEIQQNTTFIILQLTSLAITVAIVILDIVKMMTHP